MATNAQAVAANKKLREIIDQKHNVFTELVKSGDYDSLTNKLYAEKANIIAPTGETVTGRPAILEALKKIDPKADPWTIRVDECNADPAGIWAYVRGTYKTSADSGKYLTVWKKIEGDYFIWADVFNTSKAPA